MTTHPNTAESPLPWTADAMASLISDIVGENFYAPEGELPDSATRAPPPMAIASCGSTAQVPISGWRWWGSLSRATTKPW
jgi:hypothetical protein